MADSKIRAERPLSPHLQIYRPMLTMVLSIVHRITGGALYLGTILLAVWLISAATGRNIREILATEILDPLGFRWTNYGVADGDVALVAPSHVTGKPLPAPIAAGLKIALGGSMTQIIPFSNSPMFLTSVVPSSSTVSTAAELSRFAEMLRRGGELDGVRVLRPQTLRTATKPCRRLRPDVATGLAPMRWGTGYMLGSQRFGPFGRDAAAASSPSKAPSISRRRCGAMAPVRSARSGRPARRAAMERP
jgi:CubicO group peptidase (beta-lactamase class C family)